LTFVRPKKSPTAGALTAFGAFRRRRRRKIGLVGVGARAEKSPSFARFAYFGRKTSASPVEERGATTVGKSKNKRTKTNGTAKRSRPSAPILLIGVGAKKKPNYLPSTIKFYKNAPKSQTPLSFGALFYRVFLQV